MQTTFDSAIQQVLLRHVKESQQATQLTACMPADKTCQHSTSGVVKAHCEDGNEPGGEVQGGGSGGGSQGVLQDGVQASIQGQACQGKPAQAAAALHAVCCCPSCPTNVSAAHCWSKSPKQGQQGKKEGGQMKKVGQPGLQPGASNSRGCQKLPRGLLGGY